MNHRLYPLKAERFNEIVKPLLDQFKERRGRPGKIKDYGFFCAVLYVVCTGIAWREVPRCYGGWHTIYTRFKRWSESGWFWALLHALQAEKRLAVNLSWVDSTTVGVHRHGAGAIKKTQHNHWVEGVKG